MTTLSSLLSGGYTGAQGATGPTAGSRVGATGGSVSTITPNASLYDTYTVNALASAAAINAPSGTPTEGQRLLLRFKDNGTGRALTFSGATGAYRALGTTIPTTTTASKVTYVGCEYNATDSFWDVVAVTTQA
jgi:hypothetical protein